MALKLTNNATSTLATAISASDVTVSIQPGDAGKFPALASGDWFPLTVVDASGNMEIMRVTARSGSVLTVERGREATTAKAFTVGSRADLRLTVEAVLDIQIPADWNAESGKDQVKNKPEKFPPESHTHTKDEVGLKNVTNKSEEQMAESGAIADAINSAGLPVGSIIMMASDDKIVPPGCLLMNGAPVTATYPELRAHGIAVGWERNAAGDPLIPDMGGYFARGWRPGQLVDAGRVFGSVQQDALQNITGSVKTSAGKFDSHLVNGAFAIGSQNLAGSGSAGFTEHAQATFDASRVVRTAIETRPLNRTFTYWVKAYPAKVDTGSIDLANLTRDIQGVAASISDLEIRTQAKLDALQKQFFGDGQVWQSVSRPANTVFQNTTGRTIFITVNISSGYGTFQMSPDNVNWSTASEIGGGSMWVMGMPIPNGYYYKTTTGGSYRELR